MTNLITNHWNVSIHTFQMQHDCNYIAKSCNVVVLTYASEQIFLLFYT